MPSPPPPPPPAGPVAAFEPDAEELFVGERVTFTDLSDSGGRNFTDWYWTFGDGDYDTARNPSHVYSAPGAYTVTLKVTTELGASASTARLFVVKAAGQAGGEVGPDSPLYPTPGLVNADRWNVSATGQRYRVLPDPRTTWTLTRDSNRYTGYLEARWSEWAQFTRDMLGYTVWDGADDSFVRQLPFPLPWANNLYLVRLDMDRHGPDVIPADPADLPWPARRGVYPVELYGNFPNMDWMVCRAEWGQLPYLVLSDEAVAGLPVPELGRFVERVDRFQPSLQRVPSAGLETYNPADDASDLLIPDNFARPDLVTEWVYTWHQVPYEAVPRGRITDFGQTVNSVAFDVGASNLAAGTVLFKGVASDLRWYWGPDRRRYYDIPYMLAHRKVGWNNFHRLDGRIQPMRVRNTAPANTAPYSVADHNQLFVPGG